jgi:hypothetical protein
MSEPPNHNQ